MQSWAASNRYPNVTFYCINICEMEQKGRGPVIGKEFGLSYQMKDVVNGYFELSNTPTFGQLGCSGFIFADGTGKVIHKATPAFMQYGPNAFQWVERMLSKYQTSHGNGSNGGGEVNELPLDAIRVVLKGIKAQPQLNGVKGYVLRKDHSSDRFIVLLDNGSQISIKSTNFDELDEEDEDEGGCCGGAGGCGSGGCGANESGVKGCDNGACSNPCMESKCATAPSSGKAEASSCSSSACSDDRLQSLLNQPTVLLNIPSVDAEHEECEHALDTFIQERTATSLKQFEDVLIKHFLHEEELMRQAGFGGATAEEPVSNAMNAFSGHVADHHSIRDLIEQIMDSSRGDGIVCQGKVIKIVDRFKAHIERYDVLYQQDFVKAGIQ